MLQVVAADRIVTRQPAFGPVLRSSAMRSRFLPAPAVTRTGTRRLVAASSIARRTRIQAGDALRAMFNRLHAASRRRRGARPPRPGAGRKALASWRGRSRSVTLAVGVAPAKADTCSASRCRGRRLRTPGSSSTHLTPTSVRTGPREPPRPRWSRCARYDLTRFSAPPTTPATPDNVATQLATIFGTWIDFHTTRARATASTWSTRPSYGEGNWRRAHPRGRIHHQRRPRRKVASRSGWQEHTGSDDGESLAAGLPALAPGVLARQLEPRPPPASGIHGNWRHHNGNGLRHPSATPWDGHPDATTEFIGTQRGLWQPGIVPGTAATSPPTHAHLQRLRQGPAKGQAVSQGDLDRATSAAQVEAPGRTCVYEVRLSDVPADLMIYGAADGRPFQHHRPPSSATLRICASASRYQLRTADAR